MKHIARTLLLRMGVALCAATLAGVALTGTLPYKVTPVLPTHMRTVAVESAPIAPASCALGWYTNISRENNTLHYNWDVNIWYSTMMYTSGCGLVTLSNFYVFGNQPWENPCAYVRLHSSTYTSPFTYLCGPNGFLQIWMPRSWFYVEYKLPWSSYVDASQAWVYGAFTVGR